MDMTKGERQVEAHALEEGDLDGKKGAPLACVSR